MDADAGQVEPIQHSNAMEEAAERYWRASRIWREQQESDWDFQMMIDECNDITRYRGRVAYLADSLLDMVVKNLRPQLELFTTANDSEPQNLGHQS